jgi:hypothetical protein
MRGSLVGLIIGKVTRGLVGRVITDFLRTMVGMAGIGVGSSGVLKGSWGGVITPLEAKPSGGRSRGDEAGNALGLEALDT